MLPPFVAIPHLVFVCSILCGSGIILTKQGQSPGGQAANELQMSGPKCVTAGGRSDARTDCGGLANGGGTVT